MMKVYTYSEARQKFSSVLDNAKSEDVIIRRRGDESKKLEKRSCTFHQGRTGQSINPANVKIKFKRADERSGCCRLIFGSLT